MLSWVHVFFTCILLNKGQGNQRMLYCLRVGVIHSRWKFYYNPGLLKTEQAAIAEILFALCSLKELKLIQPSRMNDQNL